MDVTPRTLGDEGASAPSSNRPAGARRKRNPAAWFLIVLVVAGAGLVAVQFLNNAALYYRNADEAVRQKASLGTKRFRVQGVVQDDVQQVGNEVDFTIAFNGTTIAVRHRGDPPALFKPGIPVVLEGRWQGDVYASDRIEVKHSASYKEANPDRVSNAPE